MRVGRIPYVNCLPVYGAIDRGLVPLDATLVTGVPTRLNALMSAGDLDVSVVSAVEYARAPECYALLPGLAISCDGAVRSVALLSQRPAEELGGRRVIVSRSSMTSVALLELLFAEVWHCRPEFVPGDAELVDVDRLAKEPHEARLVIGDAALLLTAAEADAPARGPRYAHVYDLGAEWKSWTGLPFVFAVWVARRSRDVAEALAVHAALCASRDWGILHLEELATSASTSTGVSAPACREYLRGLDYGLSTRHLEGLRNFLARLASTGRVPEGELTFLTAA